MISRLHPDFRRNFSKLPRNLQRRARRAYKRFKADPSHPSLQFKPLHTKLPLWSVRVTDSCRAVGVRRDDTIIWFFVGTHAEYDRLLATLP